MHKDSPIPNSSGYIPIGRLNVGTATELQRCSPPRTCSLTFYFPRFGCCAFRGDIVEPRDFLLLQGLLT